tara:strand:- start:4544 stop:6328 length:1785 start_codon:yes stop_codon:yes gene_type:complete
MALEILIKPLKFLDAVRRLGKKKPIAKKLSSKQWAAMPTAIRERAYFTSNVESMKFLNKSKKMLEDYLSGARETVTTPDGRKVTALKKASRADFIYKMQKLAKETGLGNILPPGTDMSRDLITRMKDVASESRLKLIFDTQTQQAQAYGYYKQGQDPAILDAYPAQRFIRAEQRKVPRPLHEKNRNEVRRKDDMEFWLRMNNQSIGGFGVPFGPWGFNSGMDVEDVRRDEAIRLGLIEKNEQVLPPDDTFNKGLKAAADVEAEFLEKFMDKLGTDAINYGETVELAQKMSDVPAPKPAKPIPKVEQMVIKGLPEPEKFETPEPQSWVSQKREVRVQEQYDAYVSGYNYRLDAIVKEKQLTKAPNWIKKQVGIFGPRPVTVEQIKAELSKRAKKWADDATPFVRVKKGTLTKILKDGRFKSQFETESSGGTYSPRIRADYETKAFKYNENLNPKDRPIYGYASPTKEGVYKNPRDPKSTFDPVSMYGRIRIRLKDRARNRATITFDDSLGSIDYLLPSPMNNASQKSLFLTKDISGMMDSLETQDVDNSRYVEMQVHGGVTTDDISKVFFPADFDVTPELKEQLKKKGIKWQQDK